MADTPLESPFLVDINLNKNELKQAALEKQGLAPTDPTLAQIYFNTTDEKIKVKKTAGWKKVLDADDETNLVPTNRTINNKELSSNIIINGTEIPISNEDNTSVKDYIDNLDITIDGAASTIKHNDLTTNKALISNSNGKVAVSTVTTTELGYLSGATSNIQTQIDNLEARGRFLSVWNSTTGLPETNPGTLPFVYKTGDYYIVGVTGTTNYKPTGSSYTGTASSTIETNIVAANDVYYYDGTNWILQVNTQREVTFASITGQPTDNTNLANALNLKANLASPTFTGTPTAPTAASGTNTTQVATTAFVQSAISTYCITIAANNPALTASGGQCVWTITNTLNNQDVIGHVIEISTGRRINCGEEYSASTIKFSFNSTSNISANTYRAVIQGQKINS